MKNERDVQQDREVFRSTDNVSIFPGLCTVTYDLSETDTLQSEHLE